MSYILTPFLLFIHSWISGLQSRITFFPFQEHLLLFPLEHFLLVTNCLFFWKYLYFILFTEHFDYRILCWQLFSFSPLKIPFYCQLISQQNKWQREVSLTRVSLKIVYLFLHLSFFALDIFLWPILLFIIPFLAVSTESRLTELFIWVTMVF